jgi:hypothetical protein
MTRPFQQYAFAPLINSEGKSIGFGVKAKDERAYAQALGHAIDNPGLSFYAVARHVCETSHPELDPKTLEKRIARWRKLRHWRQNYPREK